MVYTDNAMLITGIKNHHIKKVNQWNILLTRKLSSSSSSILFIYFYLGGALRERRIY